MYDKKECNAPWPGHSLSAADTVAVPHQASC